MRPLRSAAPVLAAEPLPSGITRLRLSTLLTRAIGMDACAYLVGGVLVDAGFTNARGPLAAWLEGRPLRAVCLTHHHEDHSGLAGSLAARHGCPVYLRNPGGRFDEGLSALPAYRLAWWGAPDPYQPVEAPEGVDTGLGPLRPVPIPGHSCTHAAFFLERSGVVLVGDLFVSRGATGVMAHEDPLASAASLRRVADLSPSTLLAGHGIALDRPAAALREKAGRIETAAARALELSRAGVGERTIARRVFGSGRTRDRFTELVTGGEFSRVNFVRAVVRAGR